MNKLFIILSVSISVLLAGCNMNQKKEGSPNGETVTLTHSLGNIDE